MRFYSSPVAYRLSHYITKLVPPERGRSGACDNVGNLCSLKEQGRLAQVQSKHFTEPLGKVKFLHCFPPRSGLPVKETHINLCFCKSDIMYHCRYTAAC